MDENREFDLEEYRRAKGWSYEALCDFLGLPDRQSARETAIGKVWPRTERIRDILLRTHGEVTLNKMFRRRCEYLESVGKLLPLSGTDSDDVASGACAKQGDSRERTKPFCSNTSMQHQHYQFRPGGTRRG